MLPALHLSAQQLKNSFEWTEVSSLNKPRHGAPALSYQGKIYVFGGSTESGEIEKSVEVYDPVLDSWNTTSVEDFLTPRVNATVTLFEDEFYLMGGRDSTGNVLSNIEVFNPGSGSWRTSNELASEREGHLAAVMSNSLFILTGQDQGINYVNSIEYLMTGGGVWQLSNGNVPSPRAASFNAVVNDKLYVFGGIFVLPVRTSFSAIPDGDSLSGSALPPLAASRGNGATAILGDSILIMGGVTSSGPTDRVEIFDTATDMLTEGLPLTSGRIGSSAATIEGRVYIIGGYFTDPAAPIDLVEKLNPLTMVNVDPPSQVIEEFKLIDAWPNPFNGSLAISLQLRKRQQGSLRIVDITGRHVHTFAEKIFPAGETLLRWEATSANLPSGLYFITFNGEFQKGIHRIIFVK